MSWGFYILAPRSMPGQRSPWTLLCCRGVYRKPAIQTGIFCIRSLTSIVRDPVLSPAFFEHVLADPAAEIETKSRHYLTFPLHMYNIVCRFPARLLACHSTHCNPRVHGTQGFCILEDPSESERRDRNLQKMQAHFGNKACASARP